MNAFVNKTPFIRFLLPLIGGILLQYYSENKTITFAFLILAFLFFGFSFFPFSSKNSYKFRWTFGVGIFFFFVSLGSFIFSFQEQKNKWNFPSDEKTYICQLTDVPVEKANSILCRMQVISLIEDFQSISVEKSIIAYLKKDSLSWNLHPGDQILLQGNIVPPKNQGNPDEFDYATYLKRQDVCGIVYVKPGHWKNLNFHESVSIKQEALLCREKLLSVYRNLNLNEDELALLSAITLGYKDDLSVELKTRFSATGASHILAVSGLHVGIIYLITSFLLFPLGGNKFWQRISKQCILIICLWVFAFITGLSPSVVRAVTMFSLVAVSVALNRRSSILNTVCVAAFGMLLYNPYYLFDVGFQLSYSAVIAIVSLQPILNKIITVENRILKPLWGLITVSIAAQIGTFPITIYYFHQFPNYFILTNLLVIPLTYIIIALAVLLFFVFVIFGTNVIIKDVLEFVLRIMNEGVLAIQQLPYSSVKGIWIYQAEMWIIFLLIFSISLFIMKKRFTPLLVSLSCVILLFSSYIVKIYNSESQSKIVFFNYKESPAINLINGKHNYILNGDVDKLSTIANQFWTKHKLSPPMMLLSDFENQDLYYSNKYICFKGKTFYVLNSNDLSNRNSAKKLDIDYLVIGKGYSSSFTKTLELFSPKQIILDASLPSYISEKLSKECEQFGIIYYDVAKNGALEVDIEV